MCTVNVDSLIEEENCRFLFGFEEAIGNMIGDICFDKDGVRGAAVFAEMALRLYADGSTVVGQLNALADRYGHFVQRNGYFFCYEASSCCLFVPICLIALCSRRLWQRFSESCVPTQSTPRALASLKCALCAT